MVCDVYEAFCPGTFCSMKAIVSDAPSIYRHSFCEFLVVFTFTHVTIVINESTIS